MNLLWTVALIYTVFGLLFFIFIVARTKNRAAWGLATIAGGPIPWAIYLCVGIALLVSSSFRKRTLKKMQDPGLPIPEEYPEFFQHPVLFSRKWKNDILLKTGHAPTTMRMGRDTFDMIRNHPDLIDRIKILFPNARDPREFLDEKGVAAMLGVEKIEVDYAVKEEPEVN